MAKALDRTATYDIANRLNKMLATAIPQHAKVELTCMIENILHATDTYQGFNHVYWMDNGYAEWCEAGQPDFPEKNAYIVGPNGAKDRDLTSDFTDAKEGEYARHYYLGNLKQWASK